MNKNPLLSSITEKFFLPIIDIVFFLLSFAIASLIRFQKFNIDSLWSPHLFALIAIIITCFYIFNNYKIGNQFQILRTPGKSILATLVSSVAIIILIYILGYERYLGLWFGRGILPLTLTIFAIFSATIRFLLNRWFAKYHNKFNWLILDDISNFKHFYKDFTTLFKKENLTILATNSSDENESEIKISGNVEQIDEWAHKDWTGIIISQRANIPKNVFNTLMKLRLRGVKIYELIDIYEDIWNKIPINYLEDDWFATTHGFTLLHNTTSLKFKRIIDIFLAVMLLLVTIPVFILTFILIKIFDYGPVIYKQTRTGENKKEFTMYKIRTMGINSEANGHQWASKNDDRVTRIGKILRKLRIDELPQCINVLKGEMSFIGPRPERPEFNLELEKKIPYYNLRHVVKPGITGWAQILYQYGSSNEDSLEKLQFDLYYIKNYSLILDFAIVLKTIRIILLGRGQ